MTEANALPPDAEARLEMLEKSLSQNSSGETPRETTEE